MVKIIKNINKTLEAIEGKPIIQPLRPYLGMSQIGHSCDRYLWLSFRWCFLQKLDQRILRLFNRGNREEIEVIEQLKKIGIICHSEQLGLEMAWNHAKGHIDGIVEGVLEAPKTPHLLEIKTMNEKNFKAIQKKGVEIEKPIYFAQMQLYMYKAKLKRALFIAVNKNDDNWYIERVRYNKNFAKELEEKAEIIISSDSPPSKIYKSTWYMCKYCDAFSICYDHAPVEKNCRTCINSCICDDGIWECTFEDLTISTNKQRIGCENYKIGVRIDS